MSISVEHIVQNFLDNYISNDVEQAFKFQLDIERYPEEYQDKLLKELSEYMVSYKRLPKDSK